MDRALHLGFVNLYLFGVLIALGVLCALIFADRGMARHGLKAGTGALTGMLCVLFGFVGARALYCLCVIDYLEGSGDYGEIFRLSNGGYVLFGAIAGVLMACRIAGRVTKQTTGRILDEIVIPACGLIAFGRIAASWVDQGRGMDLEYWFAPEETDPAYRFSLFRPADYSFWQRFPFAVESDGAWYWAVFMLEAAAAILIGLYLRRRAGMKSGGRSGLFLMLYAACQVPLEAMKRGSVLRLPYLSFVRANQVFCALTLLALLILFVTRLPGEERGKAIVRGGLLLITGAILITAMEFAAFEKKITQIDWMPADVCHLLEALGSALMLMGVYPAWKRLYVDCEKQ